MSDLRRDPLLRRWVMIARERQGDLCLGPPPLPRRAEAPCPFCPGSEHLNPQELYVIRGDRSPANPHGWLVRVTPDHRPLFRIERTLERKGIGPFDLMSGVGAHELVADTPDHHAHWADFDRVHMERLLRCYVDRFNELRRDRRLRHAVVMKNHAAPWSRFRHQHSHVVAMAFAPRRLEDELAGARDYYAIKERCVFCDVLRDEERRGERIVCGNSEFVAVVPFASGFPFETWVLPRRHAADFGAAGDLLLGELAALLVETVSRLRTTLHDPQYSVAVHSGPLDGDDAALFHWHLEIVPQIGSEIGMEWATGVFCNPVPPEQAAAALRAGAPIDLAAPLTPEP